MTDRFNLLGVKVTLGCKHTDRFGYAPCNVCIAQALREAYADGRAAAIEECVKVSERYCHPYAFKASENGLSPEELHLVNYVKKEIAKAIRNIGGEEK